LEELTGGAEGVADGASEVAAGTSELATGVDGLATGSEGLATGSEGLAAGSEEIAAGTRELASGSEELADGARQLPASLAELTRVADRGGQDLAATVALLEAGSDLAAAEVGDAALVTAQLTHRGEDPVPLVALAGGTGTVVAVLGVLLALLRRRQPR
ncbi:MAG: hypothetical protein ACLFV0_12685, partial [Nitriliruptoraceae bacterium]